MYNDEWDWLSCAAENVLTVHTVLCTQGYSFVDKLSAASREERRPLGM